MPDLFTAPPANPAPTILTISALNRLARQRLESAFPLCWVSGEISNLTIAASGHAPQIETPTAFAAAVFPFLDAPGSAR